MLTERLNKYKKKQVELNLYVFSLNPECIRGGGVVL